MEDLGSWSWDLSNIHPNQIALSEGSSFHWGSFSPPPTQTTDKHSDLFWQNGKVALCHPFIDQDHFGEGHPQCGIIQLDDGRIIGPFPVPNYLRFEEEPINVSEEQIEIAKEIQSKKPFGQGMLILSTNHPSSCSHVPSLFFFQYIKKLISSPQYQSKVPLKELPFPAIHEPPFPNSFFPRQIHRECIRSAHPMISESGHVNNPAMLHLIFRGLNQFFQTHHHLPSANQSVCTHHELPFSLPKLFFF